MDEANENKLRTTGADIAASIGDAALSDALTDLFGVGILPNIPIVSGLGKLVETWPAIQKSFILKKLQRFSQGLSSVTPQQREDFLNRLQSDQKYSERVAEAVILLLNSLNDLDKPELLARVVAAYVQQKITFEEFRRLGDAIHIGHAGDLQALATQQGLDNLQAPPYLERLVRTDLATYGPVSFEIITEGDAKKPGDFARGQAELTDLGQLFVKIMTDKL